jgi:hypothetical protein
MNLSTPAMYLFASEPMIYNTSQQQQLQITTEQIIFESAVILIGIVGALGNGTVLSVFCTLRNNSESRTSMFSSLTSCLWISSAVSGSLLNIRLKWQTFILEGPTGYWLCILILSEDLSYFGIFGSKINLMSIAIERYVKIVHPIWHKKNFKSWMIYSAAAVPWAAGLFLNQ